MKARIGDVEIEGTAAEIAALIREFQGTAGLKSATDRPSPDKFVSEEVAFRAVRRRPLSAEQEIVMRTLKANHPKWTTAVELQKATGYAPSQLSGLLGALGKRVYATPGYVEGTWFLDQEWSYEEGVTQYRLPEPVLAAVTRAGL